MVTVDAGMHAVLLLRASAKVSAATLGSVDAQTWLSADWMSPGALLPRLYKMTKHLVEEIEFHTLPSQPLGDLSNTANTSIQKLQSLRLLLR